MELRTTGQPDGDAVILVDFQRGCELSVMALAAAPPGARLEMALATATDAAATPSFRLKVHRCRRQADGTFLVEGRPIDLRRETRDALDAMNARRQHALT